MKFFLEKCAALFLVLSFVFIPLTLNGKDWQFQLTNFLFLKLVALLQNSFYPKALKNIDFSSDTIALNLLLSILVFIAFTIVLFLKTLKVKTNKLLPISRVICCYYIAFILLDYGFNKIFKAQFYLPEPNILFTPFGNLTKDILYWSTLGTSRFYCISMGIIEVLAAIFILFKPTRILGLFLAIAVFSNVILINFGFDISVKTFSIFLLCTSLFAIFPYLKILFNFLILHNLDQLPTINQVVISNTFIKTWVKFSVIGLFFIHIVYPYFQSQNFNDDSYKRPFLHGAYQVTQIIKDKDTLSKANFPIKNIFIHRKNYLIFQGNNNQMTDYHFEIDSKNHILLLENYSKNKISVPFEFSPKDSTFKLQFKKFFIETKAINWKKSPALKITNHYTIDEIQ